jgi:hypothetical protein
MLYLEGTLRGDKSSTLPSGNNIYVYPSISASWVFSEMLKNKLPWLSYGKVRAGYSRVGNDTDPYQLLSTYAQYTNIDSSTRVMCCRTRSAMPTSSLSRHARGSLVGGSLPQQPTGFRPDVHTTTTKDEILPLSVSGTTGYLYKMVNSGEIQNKGVELPSTPHGEDPRL